MISILAALTAAPEPIPDLKPPRGAIPPSLWEGYGVWIVIAGIIVVLLVMLAIQLLRQPKPVTIKSAAEIARENLARLRGKETDAMQIVTGTARVLRGYLISKFCLPGPGLTSEEIVTSVGADQALAAELERFLHDCDVANFSPAPPAVAADATVSDAERLIDGVEQRTPPPLPV